jgi:hypothetical protein
MRRAQELQLRHVLLASTTGWTARRALIAAKKTLVKDLGLSRSRKAPLDA